MQQAMTEITGRPFNELMRELVLDPLKMRDSSFEQPLDSKLAPRAAFAHNSEGLNFPHRWHVYPEMAAAGLWSTPTDLAKFLIQIQRDAIGMGIRLLSMPGAREMTSPVGIGPHAIGFAVQRKRPCSHGQWKQCPTTYY
jgi:CubicO group peptidase (beta-lactamase class C family)